MANKKKDRKIEKELLGVLIFLGVLVAIFLLASTFFRTLNYFEYDGLTFSKQRVGNIPVFHHSYYFKAPAGNLIHYNLYLRVDPRENPTIVEGNKSMLLDAGSVVYLSLNTEGLRECRYSQLGVASISSFLSDNQMRVIPGNLDFWNAGTYRERWVTCENRPGNNVVEILTGNETKVEINGNCYRIIVNDCQILEAVEKLEVQSIVDAKKITS